MSTLEFKVLASNPVVHEQFKKANPILNDISHNCFSRHMILDEDIANYAKELNDAGHTPEEKEVLLSKITQAKQESDLIFDKVSAEVQEVAEIFNLGEVKVNKEHKTITHANKEIPLHPGAVAATLNIIGKNKSIDGFSKLQLLMLMPLAALGTVHINGIVKETREQYTLSGKESDARFLEQMISVSVNVAEGLKAVNQIDKYLL